MDVIDWLLDSDPAIRWQAMRDLTSASPESIAAERARVPREGLGREILLHQGEDGCWHRSDARDWLPTLFSMLLLRASGADPSEPQVGRAISRLERGFRWAENHGSKGFFQGETEPCINGGTLALGAYFGRPDAALAARLMGEQLADGGWNCDAPHASVRSSFHTTICVLEGLLEYERATGVSAALTAVRRKGEAYLLERRLFRRKSTGEIANPEFLELAYPPRYHYDVLRALDYLRDAGVHPDARMDEAVRLIESKRQPDGRWRLERSYEEALAFPFHESTGDASRWNTLRALRVLRWYKQGGGAMNA